MQQQTNQNSRAVFWERRERILALPLSVRVARFLLLWTISLFFADSVLAVVFHGLNLS